MSKQHPKTPIVFVETLPPPAKCMKCGSTARTPYTRTDTQNFNGLTPTGQPYTKIVRRWCRCAKCGQSRIERSCE